MKIVDIKQLGDVCIAIDEESKSYILVIDTREDNPKAEWREIKINEDRS